jgi:hypothetical protein
MKSQSLGLWKSERTGWYLSRAIKNDDIKHFKKGSPLRIGLRYNKYYDADSNKPRFIFAFMDADSSNNTTLEFSRDWYEELISSIREIQEIAYHGDVSSDDGKDACYKIDMLCRAILDQAGG